MVFLHHVQSTRVKLFSLSYQFAVLLSLGYRTAHIVAVRLLRGHRWASDMKTLTYGQTYRRYHVLPGVVRFTAAYTAGSLHPACTIALYALANQLQKTAKQQPGQILKNY